MFTMIRWIGPLVAAILLWCADPCAALYEDQVGKFDWRHRFVGRAAQIVRPSSNIWQDHQSLILSTRSNVLAALHLRNGSIHWRHSFESALGANNGGAGDSIDFATSGFEGIAGFRCPVLSVHGRGRYVRCWTVDGLQTVELNLPGDFLADLDKQPQSDYTFLYDTLHDESTGEPQLLMIKLTYSTHLIELFTLGFRSTAFTPIGRHQATGWLRSPEMVSCEILGRSAAAAGDTKSLACVTSDGADLHILPLGIRAAAATKPRFSRIPLSSFGLKNEDGAAMKALRIERLAYQSTKSRDDRTVTISRSAKPNENERSSSSLFAINLGGDGYLLLSYQAAREAGAEPKIELVKILPDAIKLTVIPMISAAQNGAQSTSPDTDLLEYGIAALYAKRETIPYEKEEAEENLRKGRRVFAAKLVIFDATKWTEIGALTAERILLEFGAKRATAPLSTNGRLAKRLDQTWTIEHFDIIPIRIRAESAGYRNVEDDDTVPHRYTYKMLIGTIDGTLIVLNLSGKINWSREEALAEVVSSAMLDLPLSETDVSLEIEYSLESKNIVAQFANRITTQAAQLAALLRSLQHWFAYRVIGAGDRNRDSAASARRNKMRQLERELDGEPKSVSGFADSLESDYVDDDDEDDDPLTTGTNPSTNDLVRDFFGLHKIIAVRTRIGKLFALDSWTGKILWSKFEPELRSRPNGEPRFPLWVQRTSAHYPYSAVCTTVAEAGALPLLYSFDPFTGETLYRRALDRPIAQALMIQTMLDVSTEFRRPLLLLDVSGAAQLYPDSPKIREQFARQASNYYMLIANRTAKRVTGYSFARTTADAGPVAQQVWSLRLPQIGAPQIIDLITVFKRPTEQVHSQGRVLGDRNVLYKYLNPNLVAIVWQSIDTQDKPLITLYLIDSITGNILYSIVHRRARGPVRVVHSENWVIYAYYNEKMRRNEISSIELFEGYEQVNKTAFSSIGRDLLALPIVEQQSFIFPTGIGIMSDTETQKGITTKHILISLPTGGLLELPRAFLDPRRPIKPTAEHAEEGLIPYVPELPIPSEALINYNQTIFGVRHIQTAATSLESTSLIFVYGLDIFFTRVTPSKTFDILKDDFDFWLIAAVLSALLVFSYIAKALAARKSLNAAWK